MVKETMTYYVPTLKTNENAVWKLSCKNIRNKKKLIELVVKNKYFFKDVHYLVESTIITICPFSSADCSGNSIWRAC